MLCQLEVGLQVVLEAARKSQGFFVLNAAPAMDLPAELLERCDLVIVQSSSAPTPRHKYDSSPSRMEVSK